MISTASYYETTMYSIYLDIHQDNDIRFGILLESLETRLAIRVTFISWAPLVNRVSSRRPLKCAVLRDHDIHSELCR